MKAMNVLLAALALAGAAPAAAGADRPQPRTEVRRLFGIDWQPTPAAATRAARQTAPGKPVLLLRVLGELDDKL